MLDSRILGRGALKGGIPLSSSLRIAADVIEILCWEKMSKYHTGYRAWSRELLARLPVLSCSDDFVFDNQMVVQAVHFGFRIGEIACPTKYSKKLPLSLPAQRERWIWRAWHGNESTVEALGPGQARVPRGFACGAGC